MVKYENDCCDCATENYPCIGNACSRRSVPHYYCDKCGAEEKLYDYEGQDLCESCLLEEVPVIEGSY